MKILHIIATPRAEGTPNLVLDWLATGMQTQEVFVLNSQPADLKDRLRAGAGWYGEADLFQGRGPRKFLRVVETVRKVCRERQPDLVICWMTGFANWVCAGARLALGRRATLLVHGGNPPNQRGAADDWMSRFVLLPVWLLGARCVCCSNYVRDAFRSVPGLPDALFVTVYNCVRVAEVRQRAAAARAAAEPRSTPVGIMVATMENHKDHDTLLRALPIVLAQMPGFRLRLAGDGSLRAALERLARELRVDHAVEFLGVRRDVPEWLGRSDLFVFSTTPQEGLGSVLLEALAADLPVVATDCPACREVLAGGEYGVLAPPKDSTALAKLLLQQLAAPAPGKAAREKTQAYVSRFTPEQMLREYLQLTCLPMSSPLSVPPP